MAKALDHPASLYDDDLLAWAEEQAGHLRAGHLDALDVEHLIEELDAMAGNQRRELRSRLEVLLLHMLKQQFQPKRRSRSWLSTIIEQRARIEDLLEESPSLKARLEVMTLRAYATARRRAAAETGMSLQSFPADLPYELSEILGEPEWQSEE